MILIGEDNISYWYDRLSKDKEIDMKLVFSGENLKCSRGKI